MGKPSDRDPSYMRSTHGTSKLITDYGSLESLVTHGESTCETGANSSDVAGSLRNQDDYDDWEYGTEPIPGDPTWTRKPSS